MAVIIKLLLKRRNYELKTTLTTAAKKADKKFRFKADPSYVEILKQGSIEAVSIVNNHTRDYLEKDYNDTIKTLKKASVGYFGYEHKYITEIRDIKIGILGYYCMNVTNKQKNEIKKRKYRSGYNNISLGN